MPDSESKNLNPLSIFTGFIPWISFTLVAQRLAADGVAWSALLAAVIGLVFVVRGRRTGSPTQMDIYSLILFTVIAVVGFIGDHSVDVWLYEWGRPLVGVALGLILLATSAIRPFTAEYATRSTPSTPRDRRPASIGTHRSSGGSTWSCPRRGVSPSP